MAIRSAADKLIKKIAERLGIRQPQDRRKREALTRIGLALRSRIIAEVKAKNIINDGGLIGSINYEIEGNRVIAGSFGIRYARFHEFGAHLHPRAVRAMFAAMNKRSGPKRPNKGVLKFHGDGSATLKARPFIRPSLVKEQATIMRILREYAAGK